MKRTHLLALLRVAGYHGDVATYTRLLIENRISMARAREAYTVGEKARAAGVPCTCRTCATERGRAARAINVPSESGLEIRLAGELVGKLS